MRDDDWIRPPAVGGVYRWRERKHRQVLPCIWQGVWHNPATRTYHALWMLPGGDERFAEAMVEWADLIDLPAES